MKAAVVYVNEKAVDKWNDFILCTNDDIEGERERRYVDDYVLMETGETN